MSDNEQSRKLYRVVCRALDSIGFRYEKIPERNLVAFRITGEDLVSSVVVDVEEDMHLILFAVKLMATVPEDQIDNAIRTLNGMNKHLTYGRFYLEESGPAAYFSLGVPIDVRKPTVDFIADIILMVSDTFDSKYREVSKFLGHDE